MLDRIRDPQVAIGIVGVGAAALIAGASLLAIRVGVEDEWAYALLVAGIPILIIGVVLLGIGPVNRDGADQPVAADRRSAASSHQAGGITAGTITYNTASIGPEAVERAKKRLRDAGLLDQFLHNAGDYALEKMFHDQKFDQAQMRSLGAIGVIETERVPPNPNPPLGGVPSMTDGGYTVFKLTELGQRVVQEGDDDEAGVFFA